MMLHKDIDHNILEDCFLKREIHNINSGMMVNRKCKDLIKAIKYKMGCD